MSCEAMLTVDGSYTYPCAVRCEKADGQDFGTELLPLEAARLLVWTEIPPEAVSATNAQLTLKITGDSGTLDLQIQVIGE